MDLPLSTLALGHKVKKLRKMFLAAESPSSQEAAAVCLELHNQLHTHGAGHGDAANDVEADSVVCDEVDAGLDGACHPGGQRTHGPIRLPGGDVGGGRAPPATNDDADGGYGHVDVYHDEGDDAVPPGPVAAVGGRRAPPGNRVAASRTARRSRTTAKAQIAELKKWMIRISRS